MRGLTSTESTQTLTMYQMVVMSATFSLMLPFGFLMPTWIGCRLVRAERRSATGLRNIGWTRAIHLAPTSVVSPFQYFSLIWAMMLGFLIWGDVPTVSLIIGAAIVVGSGLFLLWRESRR